MRALRFLLLAVAAVLVLMPNSWGQNPSAAPRIRAQIDENQRVTLAGNTHPYARAEYDRGAVSPELAMGDLILVLRRSPEQQKAFDDFVAGQYDASSPNFHHWLKPEEIGQRFGPATADIATLTGWLTARGFAVDEVANDRMSIRFSGNAAQVQNAFHTEIHHLVVRNEAHIANMSDPQIPSALAPVVVGVKAMHNFFAHPLSRIGNQVFLNPATGKWERTASATLTGKPRPQFGTTGGSGTNTYQIEDVAPYDFATIYNVLPLWNAGSPIDGTGQKIAIAGTANINLSDVAAFRSAFGLPANVPQVKITNTDPGTNCISANDPNCIESIENTLDVEWSGAVAKGAQIILVTSKATTPSTDNLYLSESYIVQNVVAPVMNVSYGQCELGMLTAGNAQYASLWQTAAAAGISVFVATGDAGSPACDQGGDAKGTPYVADFGLAVSGIASTPNNTAVGGTDFNWGSTAAPYWNATNSSSNKSSAKGYVPETTWNSTCTNAELLTAFQNVAKNISVAQPADVESACNFAANYYQSVQMQLGFDISSFVDTVGAGGGASGCTTGDGATVASCAGGYPKPAWQAGVSGIPNDGKRDIPDVSFFASSGFNASAYLICFTVAGSSCTYSSTSEPVGLEIGGTSASSPAMAGVMALINQKAGGPQGNPNSQLYALAAKQTYSNCDSATVTNSSSCYFNDVKAGTIAMACDLGFAGFNSPDCIAAHSGDTIGILTGYDATVGYDLATGLGTLNVANVVNGWVAVGTKKSTVTVTPSTATLVSNTAITVTAAVSGASGTPTGTVTVSGGGYSSPAQTLDSTGAFTFTIPAYSFTTGGSVILTAAYSGDPVYAVSSGTATVNVTLSTFTLSATDVTLAAGTGGSSTITVTPVAGYTGTVTLTAAVTNGPAGTAPTFTGTSVSITDATAKTGTITVATTATPAVRLVSNSGAHWFTAAGGTMLAALLFFFLPLGGRRGRRMLSGLLLIVAITFTAVGCGGGGGGGGTKKTTPGVTVSPAKGSIATTDALSVAISVSGGTSTATGSVTLTGGGYTGTPAALSAGGATINIPANSLTVGTDTLTATYSGDTNYNSATGNAQVTVKTAATTPGTYTVTVTGTGSDAAATTAHATFTLTVN